MPPPHIRYTPEHRTKSSPKPPKTKHLQHAALVKPSHSRPKPKAIALTRSERRHPQKSISIRAKPQDSEPLTPVVSIIRQNAVHPQLEPIEEVAATPQILPSLYGSDGRLTMPPALRGSHDILVHQNLMADQDGLSRVQDDEDLSYLLAKKMLVPIPTNAGLHIDQRLPFNRRFCRPWVAQFLTTLGQAHYNQFHTPLQINSAVRTVTFQVKLLRTNGNAAPADGEAASPHLTGQAVDIAKKGLSQSEIAWMRLYLKARVDESTIDVEEEFQQACFHLSVYRKYAPMIAPGQHIASTHRPLAPAIAAAIE